MSEYFDEYVRPNLRLPRGKFTVHKPDDEKFTTSPTLDVPYILLRPGIAISAEDIEFLRKYLAWKEEVEALSHYAEMNAEEEDCCCFRCNGGDLRQYPGSDEHIRDAVTEQLGIRVRSWLGFAKAEFQLAFCEGCQGRGSWYDHKIKERITCPVCKGTGKI